MIKIEHKKLVCYADGLRTTSGRARLVFLSLFGARNAVRAFWASIVGDSRRKYRYVDLGHNVSCSLDNEVKYVTLQSPLAGHARLHLVMLHPDATTQASPFAPGFMLVGTDPARRFWPRFTRMCPVPMRPAWREDVWKLGLAHGAIKPLDGFGVPGYDVATDADTWTPLVQGALAFGGLA